VEPRKKYPHSIGRESAAKQKQSPDTGKFRFGADVFGSVIVLNQIVVYGNRRKVILIDYKEDDNAGGDPKSPAENSVVSRFISRG